ncbi:hypothetical protein [Asticcacaulis sp.]|uniref:hypothetical protein n=1 Tax=Asticcacaulis sp. TaxID=1872648 RepID=UPI003F7C7427
MTAPRKFKSDAFEAIHSAVSGMERVGTIDKTTMRQFDEACLAKPASFAPAEDCVSFRLSVLTQKDEEERRGYLEIDGFHERATSDTKRQITWWVFWFEIGAAAKRRAYYRECDRYNQLQPVFKMSPQLLSSIRRRDSNGKSRHLLNEWLKDIDVHPQA